MFNYYGGFFTYKDYLNGYNGQDYMGIGQFIFLGLATITIILLSIFLRKTSHKKIDIFLKVLAIVIPILEITKIVVETIGDIGAGHGFNWTGLLPLYTCSLFIYTLPLAAFGKNKVKQVGLSFLTTLGIFAGLTNFIMAPILNTYPFFNYHTFTSLNFHFWMVFTGIFLITTKYYVPKWKDILIGQIPLVALSLIAIPLNYYLKCDYMLFYGGYGAPLLPDLANFLANIKVLGISLRPVFTLLIYILYILISMLIVSFVQLICLIKHKVKKTH